MSSLIKSSFSRATVDDLSHRETRGYSAEVTGFFKLESTLENSGIGFIEFDSERPNWCFTDHLEILLGLAAGSLCSSRQSMNDRIHPDDIETHTSWCPEQNVGEDIKYEIRLRDGMGQFRWFSIAISVEKEAESLRYKSMGTISDVDRIKNSQLESEEQVNRRDEFLAMLSHELRNPLMAIRYSVDLLTDFKQAHTSSDEFLEIISRQTDQMSRILDDLLDVSRIIQGRIQFNCETCDFNSAVRDVIETVRSNFVKKRQSINVNVCEDEIFVEGDITRIKQAMTNLLENASRYSNHEGRVEINSRVDGRHVCFEVIDDGVGILPKEQGHIFDLFYRNKKNGVQQGPGMGLGLFLVKFLVEKHNGYVKVESQGENQGSCFKIFLPIAAKRAENTNELDEARLGRQTVCLVEDIADSRIALKILLEHRGYDVFEFADAESALQRIPDIQPDAAIIDIGLPGQSGLVVAEELRNRYELKDMLMVALTGYGQEADCREIAAVGFDHHLIKPAGIRKVCQVLAEYFKSTTAG